MPAQRSSGILMHITSLPGPHGLGTLGQPARTFIDQMKAMGQSIWQVLPINPPNGLGCPYSASSTFASFDLLISFDDLVTDGLLQPEDLKGLEGLPHSEMAFDEMVSLRTPILQKACKTLITTGPAPMQAAFDSYCSTHGDAWLDNYALFAVLKDYYKTAWMDWPQALARFEPTAITKAKTDHAAAITIIKAGQFLFDHYWQQLHDYAREKGISIFGDVPIYVAQDSADVWCNQQDFKLDETGHPTIVAGCPPDNFCIDGQRWGNPIYDWDGMQKEGFSWWKRRFKRAFDLMDFVRVDHFRAFAAYWAIPASCETAINGSWVTAPGHALFKALIEEFGDDLPLIAEDLGFITPDVLDLRDSFDIAGMKVMNFLAEEDDFTGDRHPEKFPENSVAYIGTHDNDTGMGWFTRKQDPGKTIKESKQYRKWFRALMDKHIERRHGTHWSMVDVVLQSQSNMAIFQMQDILGLGSEARMNVPGTAADQWKWRMTADQLSDATVQTMKDFTQRSRRIPA